MTTPIEFGLFRDRVLEIYSGPKYARKTFLRMRQVLRELEALGVTSTADLTTATMVRFVAARGTGANPNTVNGLLGSIAAACSYAVEERWLERSPAWRRVRMREAPGRLNRPRSYEEVCRLLDTLLAHRRRSWQDARLCALAWFVALTGVRLGEAIFGHRDDLRLDARSPSFKVNPERHRLKTVKSERTVPLSEALRAVLVDWLPRTRSEWIFPGIRRRGPWTGGTTGKTRAIDQLKAAAGEVGIERITWHSLRHAFATSALERWELPLWIVQRVLGHTDIRTTQRYLHTEGSPRIARAMKGIEYRTAG